MLHYRHLHKGVTETMREWVAETAAARDLNAIAATAAKLCTEFRTGMGNLLDLAEDDLHCCLKMYQPAAVGDGRELVTWAVGHPRDGRPRRNPDHPSAESCSVYAALSGSFDGYTNWPRGLTCFCCNNLSKYFERFRCPRADWSKYYKSTLVFAIRFVLDSSTEQFDDIGYLAFDSPIKGAFADVPDIYEHSDHPEAYKRHLNTAAAFHLGAMYADAFATAMHGLYPTASYEGERNASPIAVRINHPVIRALTPPRATCDDPSSPVAE